MYIYAENGMGTYKDDDPANFRIDLGTTIELEGSWEMALLDIDLPTMKKGYNPIFLTLYSDVCSESIEDGVQRPVLHRVFKADFKGGKALTITTPRYVPINSKSIRNIHIYILDYRGEKPSFQQGRTTCTLHLRKAKWTTTEF